MARCLVLKQEHITGHDSKVPQQQVRVKEWARRQGAFVKARAHKRHDCKVPQQKTRAGNRARWQGALSISKCMLQGTISKCHCRKQEHAIEHNGAVLYLKVRTHSKARQQGTIAQSKSITLYTTARCASQTQEQEKVSIHNADGGDKTDRCLLGRNWGS